MTEDIRSMLSGEVFTPNCSVRVQGDHFFTDKKLYSNMYGLGFFAQNDTFGNNPHISPACERLPGILDDYFFDGLPDGGAKPDLAIRDAITANIDKKYKQTTAKKKEYNSKIDCTFVGHISQEAPDSIVLSYGTILPCTLWVTGTDVISASLPFSPFPNLSFLKGERTFQIVEYPLPTEPFEPIDSVTVDFAVTVKKMEIDLAPDLSGKISLEYSIEVGVTKCEISKITFEITRTDDSDD